MRKVYVIFSIIFSVLVVCGVGFTPVKAADELDIIRIIRKTKTEIDRRLGAAKDCANTKQGYKCYYSDNIEIVYNNGFADWITLYNMDNHSFSPHSLTVIGLPSAQPNFSSNYVMRWENYHGIKQISMFNKNGKIDNLYIKTTTQ